MNRTTFFGGLMGRLSETTYHEALREVGHRAGDLVEEIYDDLQEHKKQLRAIDSGRRNQLVKQVQGLYDVCRMAGTSCSHSGECISMLNLSGFFSNPFSDDRAIQNAICKMKNNPDFFASECVELISIRYHCVRYLTSVRVEFSMEDQYNFDHIRSISGDVEHIMKSNFSMGNLANDAGLLSQADGVISIFQIFVDFEKNVETRDVYL